MKTLAERHEYKFGANAFDICTVAVQKDQDYENETTYWIFEDGSALSLNSHNIIGVVNNYGLSCDNEQL